ncbi:hypothetical protein P5V15_008720 [Pogonomyrmex californicus]
MTDWINELTRAHLSLTVLSNYNRGLIRGGRIKPVGASPACLRHVSRETRRVQRRYSDPPPARELNLKHKRQSRPHRFEASCAFRGNGEGKKKKRKIKKKKRKKKESGVKRSIGLRHVDEIERRCSVCGPLNKGYCTTITLQ